MIRTRKETLPKRRINPPLIWINVRCPGIGLEWAREPWWRHPDGAVRRRPVCGRPVARPVPGRDGRQHDALCADVRRFRAGPGRRRHGAAAGRPALRVAAHRARRAASLPSRTPDDVRRSWRGMRCRDRLAAAVRHRVGGAAAVGRRAAAGARGADPARAGSRAGRLDAHCRKPGEAGRQWFPAGRRTRLPALRLPLRGAGRRRRQPATRRSAHSACWRSDSARRRRWWRSASPAMPRGGAGNVASRRPRRR